MSEHSTPMAELAGLLDAWGGAPERWPPEARRRIEEIARGEPGAQRLLAEARALDRLLDTGREPRADITPARQSALTSRIVAAAMASELTAPHAAAGAPAPVRDERKVVPLKPSQRNLPVPMLRGQWRAAALMAASLLLGVFLGGAINMAPALQDIADAIGISAEFEPTILAAGEDASDEDTL